jgi:hypothetical protein
MAELAVFGRDGGPWFAVPVEEIERFRLPSGRPSEPPVPLISADSRVSCAWVTVPVSLLARLYGAVD